MHPFTVKCSASSSAIQIDFQVPKKRWAVSGLATRCGLGEERAPELARR
jgi:hypothetical protein